MQTRTLKRPLYENCIILNNKGEKFVLATKKRCQWYLERGLAEQVSTEPFTIKLRFETDKLGSLNDAYMLSARENICVVCGIDKGLTRHHVVPYCYRRYICKKLENSLSSYDVVLTCFKCHNLYETAANQLKNQLKTEAGAANFNPAKVLNKQLQSIKSAANALYLYGNTIPERRKEELLSGIAYLLDIRRPISEELLLALSKINPYDASDEYSATGQYVVEYYQDLNEFAQRWRQHFLDTMQPKFMPQGYDVNRNVYGKVGDLK